MLLQTKYFSMTGLGVKNHKDLLDGVHLRWSFDPKLGFPRYGFKLYKKSAVKPGFEKIPLSSFPEESKWTDYHDAYNKKIAKDNFLIQYHEPNALSGEGLRLSQEKAVNISLPESSGKVMLLIKFTPKIFLWPIEFGKFSTLVFSNQEKFGFHINQDLEQHNLNYQSLLDYIPRINSPSFREPVDLIVRQLGLALEITMNTEKDQIKTITKPLTKGRNFINIDANSLQDLSIRLTGSKQISQKNKAILTRIEWIPTRIEDEGAVWTEIDSYCLPLKSESYPCSENDGKSAWRIAENRIRLKGNNSRQYSQDLFEKEISPNLEEIVKGFPRPQYEVIREFEAEGEIRDPNEVFKPLKLPLLQSLMLSALQPEMAQILGLYGLDEKASTTEFAKYKIEGIWNKSVIDGYKNNKEKLADMYQLNLQGLPHQPSFILNKNGFRFTSGTSLVSSNYGNSIRVLGNLEITCPRPIAMVELKIKPIMGNPAIEFVKSNKTKKDFPYTNPLILEDFKDGIVTIKISGDFVLESFSYGEMNYGWVSRELRLEENRELPQPKNLQAHDLPGKGLFESNVEKIFSYGTIGLKWDPPKIPIVHDSFSNSENTQVLYVQLVEEDVSILFNVERAIEKGHDNVFKKIGRNQLLPRKKKPTFKIEMQRNYLNWLPRQTIEEKKTGWPPVFYVDAGDKDEKDEWRSFLKVNQEYAYRIRGIDLFGRTSIPSTSTKMRIQDSLPPPHPMAIEAKYLNSKDPWLDGVERNWIKTKNNDQPGFRIKWVWLEGMQSQAPDTKSFNLYYKPGKWNQLEGQVLKVEAIDDESSEVTVLFERNEIIILKNIFSGLTMRQNNKNFYIMTNTASPVGNSDQMYTEILFRVEELPLPPKETIEANQSIHISLGRYPLYKDSKKAVNWTENSVGIFVKSISLSEGTRGHSEKLEFDLFVKEGDIPATMRLIPDAKHALVHGTFGVSSVDVTQNEGAVCPPLPVTAVLREMPPAPSIPDINELWASYPNYYGHAYFELTWPVLQEHENYFHQVFRAVDEVLLMIDRDQHREGHLNISELKALLNDEITDQLEALLNDEIIAQLEALLNDEITAELEELDGKIYEWRDAGADTKQRVMKELQLVYSELRNDTWQYLASLPENKKAFTTVSSPLDPLDETYQNYDEKMKINDRIEGEGKNRYFYRVGTVDKTGNRGNWSVATVPVSVPDVIKPMTPVWTKVIGNETGAVLSWRRNRESNLLHYEIYRTTDPNAATDIWQMDRRKKVDGNEPGIPLIAKVIQDQVWLDVVFSPSAKTIKNVEIVDETLVQSLVIVTFSGFSTLTADLIIDKASVMVSYQDMFDETQIISGAKAFGGQVKLQFTKELKTINGIYRESEGISSENILLGIQSGRMTLQVEKNNSIDTDTEEELDLALIRNCPLKVEYTNQTDGTETVANIPHEMTYTDEVDQSGTYYYRIIAVRKGIIGENSQDQEETIELASKPAKPIPVLIIKE